MVRLSCDNVKFLSDGDEKVFFYWLKSINCINKIKGIGREIQLYIQSNEISDQELRELIATFTRYNIDLRQLAQFKSSTNTSWFYDNTQSYWHKSVFG